MKRRYYYYVISIILIGVVIVGLVYFDYSSTRTKSASKPPTSTPQLPLYFASVSPQNINASQGTTQQVNLNLTSYCPSEIAITNESLTINGYTNTTTGNGNIWSSISWNASAQETVFNYSFSLGELILQPSMSNSTIVTIHLADNATLGSYSLDINLGKIIFLSAPENYDVSYAGGFPIAMIVTPSAHLVALLSVGEYPSSPPPNLLNISGNVTNTGETTAYNAGLNVAAYTATGTLEVNVTAPLAYDETFNQDFGTEAVGGLIGGSYSVTTLDSGQTIQIFLDIYHEGTVSNWTVTPVWTNSP